MILNILIILNLVVIVFFSISMISGIKGARLIKYCYENIEDFNNRIIRTYKELREEHHKLLGEYKEIKYVNMLNDKDRADYKATIERLSENFNQHEEIIRKLRNSLLKYEEICKQNNIIVIKE